MANAVYPLWKQELMKASASSDVAAGSTGTAGTYAALVDTGTYTYSSAHQFYSSLSGIVGTDQEIANKTQVNGTLDGDDLTYTSVTGASVEALVLYRKNSGANTTWRLILYLDTSQTGLPVTPNGGNITVTWNASGIFTLSDGDAKEHIVKVGQMGHVGVYEFSYRGDATKTRHTGFIAQEVERVVPSAIRKIDGRRHVDYYEAVTRLAA